MTTGKKPAKLPPSTPTGVDMANIVEKLKMHKSHKNMNEGVNTMSSVMAGTAPPEEGILKNAYYAGWKYAEEMMASEDSSQYNPADGNPDKTEEEKIIEVMRRGWPNAEEKSMREYHGPGANPWRKDGVHKHTEDGSGYSSADTKARNQINNVSPDVTI